MGREIRAVETFARPPGAEFLNWTVARIESEATETLHASDWSEGEIFLCANRIRPDQASTRRYGTFLSADIARSTAGPTRAKVSPVDHALVTASRDLVGRIAELIDLFARADQLLECALGATFICAGPGLSEIEPAVVDE